MKYVLPVLAFLCGAGIAYLNYILIRKAVKAGGESAAFSGLSVALRAVLNIGFLVGLYFLAVKGGFNLFALLLGGALGLTIPSFLFTSVLMKQLKNDSQAGTDENNCGGGD